MADGVPPCMMNQGKIKRLPQEVVNRIAAGEVVLRPSAAVKELLENSLDAGARSIVVVARSGGMKLLRITDDGSGILPDDLELLCQRFATSKLRKFDDLRTVATFGFRGEALASISHVSRVNVFTRHKEERLGYSASYLDGILVDKPKPAGGSVGTSLSVEDLFYNLPTRRNALQGTSEEYRAIVDVVTRYSIRYPNTAFICKRMDERAATTSKQADVRTRAGASSTDNIRAAFGDHVAQELVPVSLEINDKGVSLEGLITKSCFNLKKRIYVFFINGRLVECNPLKRAVDAAYSEFLPKGKHPFAFVSIAMRQEDIDVNVHPTKKEVLFLHETEIVEAFTVALMECLRKSDTSRTFLAQAVRRPEDLGEPVRRLEAGANLEAGNEPDGRVVGKKRQSTLSFLGARASPNMQWSNAQVGTSKIQPVQHVARTTTDANAGNMDLYMSRDGRPSPAVGLAKSRKRRAGAYPLLTSISEAIEDLRNDCDKRLAEIFKEHTFVGVATKNAALIQYKTSLFLVEIAPVIRDLFFRQILMRFSDLDAYRFNPPVPLSRLLGSHGNDVKLKCAQILLNNKEMLKDYFQIGVEGSSAETLHLVSLPLIFQGLMPNMAYGHEFLCGLAALENWEDEAPCLLGIAARLADLYGYHWIPSSERQSAAQEGAMDSEFDRRKWLLQYVLFASLRSDYDPPRSFLDEGVVREITNSARLYKVFERC